MTKMPFESTECCQHFSHFWSGNQKLREEHFQYLNMWRKLMKYLYTHNINCKTCRKKADNTYEGTTWQIKFKLEYVSPSGTYKLRLALATAHVAELQAWEFHLIIHSTKIFEVLMKLTLMFLFFIFFFVNKKGAGE